MNANEAITEETFQNGVCLYMCNECFKEQFGSHARIEKRLTAERYCDVCVKK